MEILDRVLSVVQQQMGITGAQVDSSSTKRSLDMDSLDEVEILMALEEEFGLEVSDEEAEKLVSIYDIVGYITRALGA